MLEVDEGKARRIGRHPNLVDRAEFRKGSFDFFARDTGGEIGHMNPMTCFSVPR